MRMHNAGRIVAAAALICATISAPGSAKFGVGFHWGFDYSLKMDDKTGETLDFLQLRLDPASMTFLDPSLVPASLQSKLHTTISGSDIPLFVDRTGFKRTVIDFGGKIYVDIIPVIDALELSMNFGLWEYDGRVRYPSGMVDAATALSATKIPDLFTYDTLDVTMKSAGLPNYFGIIEGTPFAKLNIDLTLRKNIIKAPKKLKVWKVYVGGGPSMHLSTPALSAGLVKDAIGAALDSSNYSAVFDALNDPNNSTQNVENIVSLITKTYKPVFGLHIVLGTMIKIPIVPLGFYVDGKFSIPFGSLDKNVKITGYGFLINGGITLGI